MPVVNGAESDSLLHERWVSPSLRYVSTLLTFGKAFVLCQWLMVLTSRRGDRHRSFSLRYVSTLLTFGKAFVLCRWLTVLTLRRERPMTGRPLG